MDSFDTIHALPYLASPLSLANMQGADYLSSIPGMDMPDHAPNYDAETFVSGDDISFSQGNMSSLKRFSTGYEDPFTDLVSQFDPSAAAPPPPPDQPPDDASNIDHNNKLLSFSIPGYNFTLLDYSLRRTSLSMTAQLHGMFFLAESPYTTSPTTENPPPLPAQHAAELTCYRRNLFQITGSVTLPRSLRYIMTDQGDRIPILAQELTVSATESVEGSPVKIISVPWKTPAGVANGHIPPPPAADEVGVKAEKEPPSIPLDIMAGQDLDTDYATFPIAWKRLQFRVATANNGRRKELQQHFVVRLKVVATLSTGAKIPICEVQSNPVIVRGRSPRNFQSRKDLPLSGSAAASRRNTQAAAAAAAAKGSPASETASRSHTTPAKAKTTGQSSSPEASTAAGNAQPPLPQQQQQTANDTASQPPSPDWTHMLRSPHPQSFPTIPQYPPPTSPQLPRNTEAAQRRRSSNVAAPIHLSLLDEDEGDGLNHLYHEKRVPPFSHHMSQRPANPDASGPPPAKARKLSHSVAPTQSRPPLPSLPSIPVLNSSALAPQPFGTSLPFSHNESADLLYEYFPLGLDDWQAPVDAVYRPHVVHHTTTMPEMKFVAAGRGRSKRYFAAEDVY